MNRWQVLINLINENKYRKIAEIGVHRGKTTRKILKACELDRFLLIDPIYSPVVSRLEGIHPAVRYYIDTSSNVSWFIANNTLDLVFLDALHDYDHVMEDITLWQPKIRSGGILCGDDYGQAHCEGVKQAVDEVFVDQVELVEIGRKGVKVWVVRI